MNEAVPHWQRGVVALGAILEPAESTPRLIGSGGGSGRAPRGRVPAAALRASCCSPQESTGIRPIEAGDHHVVARRPLGVRRLVDRVSVLNMYHLTFTHSQMA